MEEHLHTFFRWILTSQDASRYPVIGFLFCWISQDLFFVPSTRVIREKCCEMSGQSQQTSISNRTHSIMPAISLTPQQWWASFEMNTIRGLSKGCHETSETRQNIKRMPPLSWRIGTKFFPSWTAFLKKIPGQTRNNAIGLNNEANETTSKRTEALCLCINLARLASSTKSSCSVCEPTRIVHRHFFSRKGNHFSWNLRAHIPYFARETIVHNRHTNHRMAFWSLRPISDRINDLWLESKNGQGGLMHEPLSWTSNAKLTRFASVRMRGVLLATSCSVLWLTKSFQTLCSNRNEFWPPVQPVPRV